MSLATSIYSRSTYRAALFLKRRQHRVVLLSALIVAILTVLYLFDPATANFIYPPSPSRVLLGIYCPGCGTLRGLHQLLHGNLGAAFGFNPLMVLSLPYLAYAYLRYSLPALTGKNLKPLFIQPHLIWWLVKVILAYWLLRNIPHPFFSWMAP
jgi:hypothetical protein